MMLKCVSLSNILLNYQFSTFYIEWIGRFSAVW